MERELRNDDVYPSWQQYCGPSFIGLPASARSERARIRSSIRGLIFGALIGEAYKAHPSEGPVSWGIGFQELLMVLDGLLQSGGLIVPQDFACRLRYWSRFGFPGIQSRPPAERHNAFESALPAQAENSSENDRDESAVTASGAVVTTDENRLHRAVEQVGSASKSALDEALESAEHVNVSDAFVAYPTRVSEHLRHTQDSSFFVVRSLIAGVVKYWNFAHVLENAKLLCKTTHADEYAVAGAVAAAVAVASALQRLSHIASSSSSSSSNVNVNAISLNSSGSAISTGGGATGSSSNVAVGPSTSGTNLNLSQSQILSLNQQSKMIAEIRDTAFDAASHELSVDASQRYRRGFKLVEMSFYKSITAAFDALGSNHSGLTFEEKLRTHTLRDAPHASTARAVFGALFGLVHGVEQLPHELLLRFASHRNLIDARIAKLESLLGVTDDDDE